MDKPDLNELKKYYKYEFIVDDLLKRYKDRESAKSSFLVKKKEIEIKNKLSNKNPHFNYEMRIFYLNFFFKPSMISDFFLNNLIEKDAESAKAMRPDTQYPKRLSIHVQA